MQGQGQQSFFSSVNLHKICGCSDMAWLGVCARCTGIAAQLQRRQNVKEGGKRSVPLASTFTGGEQGLMHSWYLSQSPAVTHLFQVAYHFPHRTAMNRLLASCTIEMKLTWAKLMLQMGHPKWQISGTGAWDVAIEDSLWRRECYWDVVIEHAVCLSNWWIGRELKSESKGVIYRTFNTESHKSTWH